LAAAVVLSTTGATVVSDEVIETSVEVIESPNLCAELSIERATGGRPAASNRTVPAAIPPSYGVFDPPTHHNPAISAPGAGYRRA